MRQKSTFVGLFFVIAAILVAWVLHLSMAALFAIVEVVNRPLVGDAVTLSMLIGLLVAAGAAIGLYLHQPTNKRTGEVLEELNKVNWPSWAETKMNTLVVIATSVIAAMILGVFDITFAQLSDWLASVNF
jgi:preprotein translocase SecE subunit